jgi:chemotaxis protein CheD
VSRPQRVLVRRGSGPALDPALDSVLPDEDGAADARAKLYLHPGQLFASAKPTRLTTIVGSSVAVCLFDPTIAAGGMCHFQLPHAAVGADASARFGGVAVERLVARLTHMGAEPSRLRARLFGGACPIEAFRAHDRHLGAQNVEAARRLLEAGGIVIDSEDVGGSRSRKLRFRTDDGDATARLL